MGAKSKTHAVSAVAMVRAVLAAIMWPTPARSKTHAVFAVAMVQVVLAATALPTAAKLTTRAMFAAATAPAAPPQNQILAITTTAPPQPKSWLQNLRPKSSRLP